MSTTKTMTMQLCDINTIEYLTFIICDTICSEWVYLS